jgi:hypothetical protein
VSDRFESVVEKAIREAQERGEFDNLPGKGKPLPGLSGPHDELWWVRDYIKREGLTNEDLLPEPIRLRKQLDTIDADVASLPTERAVRDYVTDLNRQIRRARIAPDGPPILLRTADPERAVERWLANRPVRQTAAPLAPPDAADDRPRSRWQRLRGRLAPFSRR